MRRRTGPILSLLLLPLLLPACRTDPAPARRPNLVVFLVDDLGWQDLSEPFHSERTTWNERYRTPNVERLCRQGIKFTQAYAHCVCTPTRVSLMTGINPARHRVTHWTLRRNTATDPELEGMRRPQWNVNGLSCDAGTERAIAAPTLAQRLAAVGYRTILAGKAHFGAIDTPGADPRNLGFHVNIAGHAAGAPSSYLARQNFLREQRDTIWQVPGLERYHGQDLFLTEVLTTEAIAAAQLGVAAGEPFFLYLAHYAVHTPLDADDRFVQRYRDAGLPEPEARYAALIEGVDRSLGRVLDWLDRAGIAGDTIVMFTSDNGGLSAHTRAGPKHGHNSPLRSGKGSAYEGGVRVPLAVRWPGRIAADQVATLPVSVDDVLPTLCELVGADSDCPDGRSYAACLLGADQTPHPLLWHSPHFWGARGPGIEPYSAVRDGDHKLIWFYREQRAELYDVRRDPGETTDLAPSQPELTARLRALLRQLLSERDAQLPMHQDGSPFGMP
ncbi:MAG: sulfatase [Planctomycetes bacterium]|nr:sulfatase [Planctomycetota bacterium]